MNLLIAILMWSVIIAGCVGALPVHPFMDVIFWVCVAFASIHAAMVAFGFYLVLKGK